MLPDHESSSATTATQSATTTPTWSKLRWYLRHLRNLLILSTLLLLLLGSGLTWVIATENGLRFLVNQAQQWLPGELKIDTLRGRLIDNFSGAGISYRHQDTVIKLGFVSLAWEAKALLKAQIHIQHWQVDQLEVDLPKPVEQTDQPTTPFELPSIKLPVAIALDEVQLTQIKINRAQTEPIIIDHIVLHSTSTDVLTLAPLQIQSSLVNAKLTGQVGLQKPHPVQLRVEWSTPVAIPPLTLVGEGEISGDLQQLVISHHISKPLDIQLHSTIHEVLGALRLEGHLKWQTVSWPLTTTAPQVNSPQGYFAWSGTLDQYQITLDTQVSGPQIPSGHWQLTAKGNTKELTVEKLRAEWLQGLTEMTGKVSWQPQLTAQLQLTAKTLNLQEVWPEWPPALRLDSQLVATLAPDKFEINQLELSLPQTATRLHLTGVGTGVSNFNAPALTKMEFKRVTLDWQNLHWPLTTDLTTDLTTLTKLSNLTPATDLTTLTKLSNLTQGHLQASGNLQNYRFDLSTQLTSNQIPSGQWNITGQGNLQQVEIAKLYVETLNGTINGLAKIQWQPQLTAQVKVQTHQLTVAPFWRDWPDQLGLNSKIVANLAGDQFNLEQLELSLPPTAAKLLIQGQGVLVDKQISQLQTTWHWEGLQWPLLGPQFLVGSQRGQMTLTGNLQNYQVALDTQVDSSQLAEKSKLFNRRWQLKGHGNLQQFNLDSLRTELLQGAVMATGQVQWQPSLTAQLQLSGHQLNLTEVWPEWPTELTLNSQWTATWANQHLKITQGEITLPALKTKVLVQGEGDLSGSIPQFNTMVTWQQVPWPLTGKNLLLKTEWGKLTVAGTGQTYQVQLDTEMEGPTIPKGRWQLAGQGDNQHFQLTSLNGEVLQGRLNLAGQFTWHPNLSWELALQGDKLNPGSQWAQWPGQLKLALESAGQFQPGQALTAQLNLKQVQGTLRDYPLKLQTQLAMSMPLTSNDFSGWQQIQADLKTLDFQAGPARLTAAGKLGSQSNLSWTIKVPTLTALLPESSGSVTGKGRVTGPLLTPVVMAELNGKSLVFQDQQLKNFQGEIAADLQTGKNLHLKLIATGLTQGNFQLDRWQVQGEGSLLNHTLTTEVKLPTGDSASLQAQGGVNSAQWQGQLQQVKIDFKPLGSAWQLQTPVTLSLAKEQVQLSSLCLRNREAARVCTQLNWQPQTTSNLQLKLQKIPLNLLRASLLPTNSLNTVTGLLEGDVTASLAKAGTLTAQMLFKISPGIITTTLAEGETEAKIFPHRGGQLSLQIDPKGLTAQADLRLLKQSQLSGYLQLPALTRLPLSATQPLRGQWQVDFEDLSILPTLVPRLENTQGKVSMKVTLSGELSSPLIWGQLLVQNLETDLPELGLQLRKVNLTVSNRDRDTWQVQATANSGEGQLQVKGEAKLRSMTDWQGQLTVTGKNVEVVNIPAAWVSATPELSIQLSPPGVSVTGQITIPQAVITPPEATSGAVTVSSDVVIINPIQPAPKNQTTANSWPITSNVKIILGDQVTFKGAGLKTQIGGTVRASNQPNKVTVGNGELLITGTYKAYGQDLTVQHGRVIFTGGAIDNPGLDIRAFRQINQRGSRPNGAAAGTTNLRSDEAIIAGVRIQGTAKSPQIILYSIPTLDQSNILSYIVLGKPIAQASGAEGRALLGAALASQFQGDGESLTQKIGQRFGLDEATIVSEGGIAESALVIGKYLTPDLYISYGIGLFDASTLLRIRYHLTQRLTLESETGKQSGVDLRYSLER